MDYSKILLKKYSKFSWNCGETYESLEWKDTTTEKPSEEELNIKLLELKKQEIREIRNELLKECDYKFVSDYIHSNDEKKGEWLSYRKLLRDFPSIWVEGMEYPTKPE
jgi:hypothetical protein